MTTETTTTNDATSAATDAGTTTALGDAATADTSTEDAKDGEQVKPEGENAEGSQGADAQASDADGKDGASLADAVGAPDAYDTAAWEMPEGVEFDKDGFEAVEPVLRELNLSNDQAGKLMGAYAEKIVPMLTARAEKQMNDQAQEMSANLARDLQADPEVGGAKLKEAQAYAAKAIASAIPDAAARAEFSQFLNESGLGNHPLLTRVLNTAGRAMSEASTPSAGAGGGEKTAAEIFYGTRKG